MHDKLKPRSRRDIPAVGKVLDALGHYDLPRPVIVDLVRRELAAQRRSSNVGTFPELIARIRSALAELRRTRLHPVINGTGIIIHTNLGRAPMSADTAQAVAQIASNYSNLELDVASGQRGSRGSYLEQNLATLCQAEAATVVNNCAAALVLIARHFAIPGREVIISRGELVQIGGGFRIGEILESAGIKLREVGATNRTSISDYAKAITKNTALILSVHRSNFFMEGFVESAAPKEIAQLARKKRVPFVVDLGSGLLAPMEGMSDVDLEPTPAEMFKCGADLLCFSGDKLFGGPQAGIIAGKKRFVAALKRDPLFRALRCDKLCLAALQSTVDLHLTNSISEIPALALVRVSKDELRARAANIITRLRGLPAQINVGRGSVKSGGGTLPKAVLSSVSIDIVPEDFSVNEFAARLRAASPPIIGHIASGCFKFDLRTIFPEQDDLVVDAIRSACTNNA